MALITIIICSISSKSIPKNFIMRLAAAAKFFFQLRSVRGSVDVEWVRLRYLSETHAWRRAITPVARSQVWTSLVCAKHWFPNSQEARVASVRVGWSSPSSISKTRRFDPLRAAPTFLLQHTSYAQIQRILFHITTHFFSFLSIRSCRWFVFKFHFAHNYQKGLLLIKWCVYENILNYWCFALYL